MSTNQRKQRGERESQISQENGGFGATRKESRKRSQKDILNLKSQINNNLEVSWDGMGGSQINIENYGRFFNCAQLLRSSFN